MRDFSFDIVASGRPYADLIADIADESLIQKLGFRKGQSTAVTAREMMTILPQLPRYEVYAGGSPSNTCAVVQSLGGNAAFIGKVCNDVSGRLFRDAFVRCGVHFATPWYAGNEPAVSGTCIILKTSDGAETMIHCPGVGDVLTTADMDEEVIGGSKVLYLQAHLLFADSSIEAAIHAIQIARQYGRMVAFSLHDHQMNRERADVFLAQYLTESDVVTGNQSEFQQVFGGSSKNCVRVMTQGSEGATISTSLEQVHIPALTVPNARNTIGAGDAFAAGFLYAYPNGSTLMQSGTLGAVAAARILECESGRPECV